MVSKLARLSTLAGDPIPLQLGSKVDPNKCVAGGYTNPVDKLIALFDDKEVFDPAAVHAARRYANQRIADSRHNVMTVEIDAQKAADLCLYQRYRYQLTNGGVPRILALEMQTYFNVQMGIPYEGIE